jgi:hypothetical protein
MCMFKLALTSPTSGGLSVGILRLQTKATELCSNPSYHIQSTLSFVTSEKFLFLFIAVTSSCQNGNLDKEAAVPVCIRQVLVSDLSQDT